MTLLWHFVLKLFLFEITSSQLPPSQGQGPHGPWLYNNAYVAKQSQKLSSKTYTYVLQNKIPKSVASRFFTLSMFVLVSVTPRGMD